MRLVLVHGINNQGGSSAAIAHDWVAKIEATLGKPGVFTTVDTVAPFYGDVLHSLENTTAPEELVAQGLTGLEDEGEAFVSSALLEIALNAGVTNADVATEVAAMGLTYHNRNFIALVRLIETLSPFQGQVAMRLLNQAYAYLKHDWVAKAVDDIVGPALTGDGPMVVVGHSLGSVVTFKLLRKFAEGAAPRNVPLYVTIGSPLAIKSVQAALGKPRVKPQGVGRWLNGRDPDDFVTLGEGLTEGTFAPGIDNLNDISNPGDDAHAVMGYLGDKRLDAAIATGCGV